MSGSFAKFCGMNNFSFDHFEDYFDDVDDERLSKYLCRYIFYFGDIRNQNH